jgi:Protein of unknown function (DUF3145)
MPGGSRGAWGDEVVGEDEPRRWQGGLVTVRGVLQVHSAPPALSPHIEWAVAGVLGVAVRLPWVEQPASPGTLRAELNWQGRPGTGGAITSALASWNRLRFEVTEEASPGCDAVRYSCTPSLGTFSAVVSANGDVLVPEGRLRAAMTLASASVSAEVTGSGSVVVGLPSVGSGRPGPAGAGPGNIAATSEGAPPGDGIRTLRDRHGPRHPALGGSLEAELRLLLGQPWDDELEPFRHAAAGAPVRWLHATG